MQDAQADPQLAGRNDRKNRVSWTGPSKASLLTVVGGLIWFGACFVGFKVLFDYGQTPGTVASLPVRWPASSTLHRKANQATLVMFIHPHCPCSRASIGELARLMTHSSQQFNAYVLFLAPKDYPTTWVKSELWKSAAAIPGVQTFLDPDGSEARRFHATTSGGVAIYNSTGTLVFSGGITPSRGHFGDSVGLDSALASLSESATKPCRSAVFGCPLFEPSTGSKNQ
jgi:hypothetical protein